MKQYMRLMFLVPVENMCSQLEKEGQAIVLGGKQFSPIIDW